MKVLTVRVVDNDRGNFRVDFSEGNQLVNCVGVWGQASLNHVILEQFATFLVANWGNGFGEFRINKVSSDWKPEEQ